MRCRYCNIALAPSRSFVDGEFCCDDHRQVFESESDQPAFETESHLEAEPYAAESAVEEDLEPADLDLQPAPHPGSHAGSPPGPHAARERKLGTAAVPTTASALLRRKTRRVIVIYYP